MRYSGTCTASRRDASRRVVSPRRTTRRLTSPHVTTRHPTLLTSPLRPTPLPPPLNQSHDAVLVQDVATIKEYSCVEGLVALDKECMGDLDAIHEAMLKVKEEGLWSKPVFT